MAVEPTVTQPPTRPRALPSSQRAAKLQRPRPRLGTFVLRFELRLIIVAPDPNKFVLRPIHPGADDGYADPSVQHHDVFFEALR